MTNDEIDRRIEAWQEGDSNDEEIDGLTEIVRELQEERAREGIRIILNPEAFEKAMLLLNELTGWRVELTLTTGEKHDVRLQGVNRAHDRLMWRPYEGYERAELEMTPWEQVASVYVY